MVGTAVFFYGLLVSFIFSGASRNAKLRRPNPPAIQYFGYLLCGLTGGGSLILLAHALGDALGVPLLPLTR
jgi:xanthosine utilization system XapX-like protein